MLFHPKIFQVDRVEVQRGDEVVILLRDKADLGYFIFLILFLREIHQKTGIFTCCACLSTSLSISLVQSMMMVVAFMA